MRNLLGLFFILITFNLFSQGKTEEDKYSDFIKIQKKLYDKYLGLSYPEFKIKTSNSQLFSNKDIANKVVLINFWSKHCSPCISETAGLIQLYTKLKSNPNFTFVSFTYDPDSTIDRLVRKYNINYKVYHLDKNEFQRLNFNNGMPTNIILDKYGTIKYFYCGGPIDKEQATKDIMNNIYVQIQQLIDN